MCWAGYQETFGSFDDLVSLTRAVRKVSGVLQPDAFAQHAAEAVRRYLRTGAAIVAMVEPDGTLRVRGVAGDVADVSVFTEAGLGGRIMRERRPVVVADCERHPGGEFRSLVGPPPRLHGIAGVPAIHLDHIVGVIYVGTRSPCVSPRSQGWLVEYARSIAPLMAATAHAETQARLSALQERERIAVELHDTVGQLLFGMILAAREAQAEASNQEHELLSSLCELEQQASQAGTCLRESIRTLRPAERDEDLVALVRSEIARFAQRTGIAADAVVLGRVQAYPGELQPILLRVLREGLHNIEKHASAASVVVTLIARDSEMGLVIQDDGRGLEASATPNVAQGGFGLRSLRHDVDRLGGGLAVSPNEDGGTTLTVGFPLPGGEHVPEQSLVG